MTQRPTKLVQLFLIVLLLGADSGVIATGQAPAPERPATETGVDAPGVAPRPRRVLALYSESSDLPIMVSFSQRFYEVLRQESGRTVDHYPEYFDAARFRDESQKQIMVDYLRRKYADRTIDVLFAWGPFALQLVVQHRNELFPDSPIVYYSGTLDEIRDYPQPPMTGVLNLNTYDGTLEVALDLHPDTREVFIISGTPSRDKSIEHDVARQLRKFEGRVKLTYLTDLPLDRLMSTVKTLPKRSIIIYSRQQSREDTGKVLLQADYVDLVSRAAPVPVYGPWRSLLGYGSVGGVVDDREAGATKAAEIVLRVARGARPQDVPPDRTPRIPTFDARQLARWGIAERRLPPGSLVLYREPTVWSQYRSYIIATGVVLALQSALIGGLLVQRARRRRAEGALRESEQRYALATAAGSVGVWDWNLDTGEMYVDPALKGALGFADRDIENRFDSWSERVDPEDAGRLRLDAEAHVAAETPFFENERRMRHRDGSVRWFLTRGSAVREPDGRVRRITGTDTDITERKSVEARLDETRGEFTRIARVTALAEYAASIAHEVSQPLGAIVINSRACLRWLNAGDAPAAELREALLDIVEAANRADEVVSRDRELFRQHVTTKQALDIGRVVKDVTMLVKTRLEQHQIALTLRLDDSRPVVVGDRVELQQVLLNLIGNSIEAMEAVDPGRRTLTVEARLNGERLVEIAVRDTGIGMQEVDASRLFAPFYTTKAKGTGVGLSISRTIVESHGGTLWAEAGNGPGATFRFTLPLADP